MQHRLITARRIRCGPSENSIENGAVLLDDATIRAVGPVEEVRAQAPADTEQWDYPHGTIIPGLINAHVHLCFDATSNVVDTLTAGTDAALSARIAVHARQLVAAGFTTIRDLGDRNGIVLRERGPITHDPTTPGPRILAAGTPLTTPNGHCWFLGGAVDSPDEIRRLIRHNAAQGADVIKVMASGGHITPDSPAWHAQFGPEQLRVIVEEAHAHGLPVAAHAHGTTAIDQAVAAGATTIEHCTWMGHDGQGTLEDRPDIARRMGAAGTVACPAWPSDWPALLEMLGADLGERAVKNIRQTADLGAELIFGTDAGVIRASFDADATDALSFYEHAGFSRSTILDMATTDAAAALGIDGRVGQLAPGYAADLLVVAGDPVEDLDAIRRRELVLASGRAVREP